MRERSSAIAVLCDYPGEQVVAILATRMILGTILGMEKTIYTVEYRALLYWIKQQRRLKGLTMRDLADMLNVHHSWVGRIEQGERRLDIVEYVRICSKLGCDARDGLKLIMSSGGKGKDSAK